MLKTTIKSKKYNWVYDIFYGSPSEESINGSTDLPLRSKAMNIT